MALNPRIKIAIVGAGLAAAGLAATGTALAAGDPGGDRTELRIVEYADGPAAADPATAKPDCPDKGGAAPAADTR
ncbi:hypothetical protein GCM10009678_93750 [Actinomadura kijaniata]|uniref:Uncharacterized protein n=1 Tax=Actinomadura namibiensis TaxID=182080 RepID=A0A7W3LIV2_ACTNM|nr:hypothetical protein [Actinomadura namibiensis]MBA8948967.1 hypothetical protein [Actinomadura namibiensis]